MLLDASVPSSELKHYTEENYLQSAQISCYILTVSMNARSLIWITINHLWKGQNIAPVDISSRYFIDLNEWRTECLNMTEVGW